MATCGLLFFCCCSCSYYYFLLLLLFCFTMAHCSPEMGLTTGHQLMIPVPTYYEDGFAGRAILATVDDKLFQAALSVEGVGGEYLCSLLVLLGDVKVWASDHISKFPPKDRCVLEVSKEGEVRLVDSCGTVGWSSKTRGQLVKKSTNISKKFFKFLEMGQKEPNCLDVLFTTCGERIVFLLTREALRVTLFLQKLRLLETGNLLLQDSNNRTKWQSFDHPGDTLVWSQVLGPPSILTSSLANSSSSFYSFEIQLDRSILFLNVNNSKYSYWDLRTKNNRSISFTKLGSSGLKLFGSDEQKIGQVKTQRTEPVRFLRLGKSGALILYYYSAEDGSFKASYQAPEVSCDLPFPCGPYGICMHANSCSCLSLRSKQDDAHVSCENNAFIHDHSWTTESVKKMTEIDGVGTIFRTEPQRAIGTGQECMATCRDDSSCHAAMYVGNSSECFHYCTAGGIRQIGSKAGVTYWVKIPNRLATRKSGRKRTKEILMIVAIVVDGVAVCFILGGAMFYFLVIQRNKVNTRVASS